MDSQYVHVLPVVSNSFVSPLIIYVGHHGCMGSLLVVCCQHRLWWWFHYQKKMASILQCLLFWRLPESWQQRPFTTCRAWPTQPPLLIPKPVKMTFAPLTFPDIWQFVEASWHQPWKSKVSVAGPADYLREEGYKEAVWSSVQYILLSSYYRGCQCGQLTRTTSPPAAWWAHTKQGSAHACSSAIGQTVMRSRAVTLMQQIKEPTQQTLRVGVFHLSRQDSWFLQCIDGWEPWNYLALFSKKLIYLSNLKRQKYSDVKNSPDLTWIMPGQTGTRTLSRFHSIEHCKCSS